jgi:putative hydrolase of the HAD superfamily
VYRAPPAEPRAVAAALFDAAGTLIELREPVGETYARYAREYGVDLPGWRIDDAFRRVFANAPPLVFPGIAPDAVTTLERAWWRESVRSTFLATDGTARFDDFDACFDALFEAFSQTDTWRLRPGCLAMLERLRARGIAIGVVSNFDRRLPGLLARLGIAPLVDTVVLPSDAGAAKPDPRIFELALARLGVTAAAAVFVGDSPDDDLRGAEATGLRTVDVKRLANLADFPDRLDQLTSSPPEPSHD